MASSSFSTTAAAIMAAALLLLATITVTEAQGTANFPSCASKLVPCAEYIGNTTKPPATCCDPIKEAVKTELPCLCNLYNTPGLLNSFGINVTQAIGLTKRCGISADISNCSKVPTAGAQSPTSSAVPTPPSRGKFFFHEISIFSRIFLTYFPLFADDHAS
ncbi:Non-specific lipid transfer protein GPI-anchored 7 [Linum perenne]